MPKSPLTRNPPEEGNLRHAQEVLRIKEAILVEKELELSTLLAELLHFRSLYTETVGRLYVELDELRARKARRASQNHPDDVAAERRAKEAEGRAEESRSEFHRTQAETSPFHYRVESLDLKETYRRLAKAYYPDLADNEEEVARLTEVMTKINAAYAAGDLDALLQIERDAKLLEEAMESLGASAELARTMRKIHQADSRITEIDKQIVESKKGDDWRLYVQWKQLQKRGIDLLAQLCQDLREQIAAERAKGGA